MEFVGRAVAKKFRGFGNKLFRGKVVGVEDEDGVQYFKIRYDDDDEEEVELKELKRILQAEPKAAGSKRKSEASKGQQAEPDGTAAGTAAAAGTAMDTAAGPSKRQARASGGGKAQAKAPVRSLQTEVPVSVDEQQLKGMVEEVAAKSKALEADMVRHAFPAQHPAAAAGEPSCARAVTCGGLCFLSAIKPQEASTLAEDASASVVLEEYRVQTADVLAQLDDALQEAGSGRDQLVNLTVILKDAQAGKPAFVAIYNKWCNRHALPAITIAESYLGNDELLVSIAAVAAVPIKCYT